MSAESPLARRIQFESSTEPFDTTDRGGELFFQAQAASAQMQRQQITESRWCLAAAKAPDRSRAGQ